MDSNDIDDLEELLADKKFRSTYKGQSLKCAKQLGYPRSVIRRIKDATSDIQIEQIMLGEAKRSNHERDERRKKRNGRLL